MVDWQQNRITLREEAIRNRGYTGKVRLRALKKISELTDNQQLITEDTTTAIASLIYSLPEAFGGMAVTTTLSASRSLVELAKELHLNFFLVSYTDLLGGTRAKLVPAAKIATVEADGAVRRLTPIGDWGRQ